MTTSPTNPKNTHAARMNGRTALAVPDRLIDHTGTLLDEYDTLITDLDAVLAELQTAKLALMEADLQVTLAEAQVMLQSDGKNADERKARLVILLHESGTYQRLLLDAREAKERVGDAERRYAVTRERLRLVRAALALAVPDRG